MQSTVARRQRVHEQGLQERIGYRVDNAHEHDAGFAARVAGKPVCEMLTLLSRQGIAITGEGLAAADEVREDMRRARKWLVSRSEA